MIPDNDQWFPDSNPMRSLIYVGLNAPYIIPLGNAPIPFTNVVRDSLNMWDPAQPTRFIVKRRNLYLLQGILTVIGAALTSGRISVRLTTYAEPPDPPVLIYDRPYGAVALNGRMEFTMFGQFFTGDYLEVFLNAASIGVPSLGTNLLFTSVKFGEIS